jgi:hypothetical protein
VQRSGHDIEDEIVFETHDGWIFHEPRGFESGSRDELKIVQDFVPRRWRERRLKDRLHAIWFVPLSVCIPNLQCLHSRYCVPMDNDRPSLDLRILNDICPERNGASKHSFMNLRLT